MKLSDIKLIANTYQQAFRGDLKDKEAEKYQEELVEFAETVVMAWLSDKD